MKNTGAILAGLFAVIIWAAIPSLVKIGSSSDNFMQFLVLRFALALIFFIPLIPTLIRKSFRIEGWRLAALGGILAANYYFQTIAMQGLPASWYVVIFSLNPLLALIALRVRVGQRLIRAVSLSLIGTLLFVQSDDLSSLTNIWTVSSLIAGMLTWVTYTVLIADMQKVFTDIEATGLTQIMAFTSLSLLWAAHGFPGQPVSSIPWTPVVILGLSTPLAFFGFNYCLRRVPTFCVLSQYLEPVVGVGLGVFLFKEHLSVLQICGAVAIVLGTSRVH
jgi:drug/metabolite transporter (DMT)-like permease